MAKLLARFHIFYFDSCLKLHLSIMTAIKNDVHYVRDKLFSFFLSATTNQVIIDNNTNVTKQHCFIIHKTDSTTTFSKTSSLDSVDLAHVKEIGAYLLRYDSVPESISSLINSSINTSNSTLSSSGVNVDSNFSKITSASLTSDFIKHSQSSCMCHQIDQDKEKFLHQNCGTSSVPSFLFCVNCGGNFSIQYINSTTTSVALTPAAAITQSSADNMNTNGNLNGNLQVCNCLLSSIDSVNGLAKSHSADQLMTFRREVEIMETAKSHTGIPNQIDASMEAALNQEERCESGF